MKKVIIIAMLLSLLCVCSLSAGVCFADEASTSTTQRYYFEASVTTPNLYLRASADGESRILLYIPHSYAFEKIEEANGAFVKVKYNEIEGYIQTNALTNNCKQVTSKWGNNAYEYEFPNITVTASQFTLYSKNDMTAIGSEEQNRFRIDKVYGYYYKDKEYYFLADTSSISMGSYKSNELGYIKATDTSLANFNENSIPESAGYKAQTTADNNPPTSGNINSGNPNGGNNGTTPKDTSNSFERYILIAVNAVLCVVIIILIFAPTRKRQH